MKQRLHTEVVIGALVILTYILDVYILDPRGRLVSDECMKE